MVSILARREMHKQLKEKAVKGISWNLLERVFVNTARFIIGVILARLLTPKDFGLIGMITVFFAIAQVFINGGFGQAYIQKKDVTDTDANTVFIINFAISLVIYGFLWVFAPEIAKFYGEPELLMLTRIMGLVIIINSFNVIQIAQMRRELNFKRKAKVTTISTILSGILGIVLAILGYGVWSLVVQQLSNRLITTVGFYFCSNWKFMAKFSKESFTVLFAFGGWLLASGIVIATFDNIYRLAIGKFYPAFELGLYTKAKQMQGMITDNFISATNSITFPVFSQLQNELDKMEKAINKFLKYSYFFIFPSLVTLLVVAKPLVILLLTDKWVLMVPYLQLFCIVGILKPIYTMNLQVIESVGKSKLAFVLVLVAGLFRVTSILLLYKLGVIYLLFGEIFVSFGSFLINFYLSKPYTGLSLIRQLGELKWISCLSVCSGIMGFLLFDRFDGLWAKLCFPAAVIPLAYVGFMFLFQKNFLFEVFSLKHVFFAKRDAIKCQSV